MKKLGMFMIMGALAWGLQACNNSNQNEEGATGTGDSLYNEGSDGMMSDTSGMGMDTMGTGTTGTGTSGTGTSGSGATGGTGNTGTGTGANGGMSTDTTGTNRPNTTP